MVTSTRLTAPTEIQRQVRRGPASEERSLIAAISQGLEQQRIAPNSVGIAGTLPPPLPERALWHNGKTDVGRLSQAE